MLKESLSYRFLTAPPRLQVIMRVIKTFFVAEQSFLERTRNKKAIKY